MTKTSVVFDPRSMEFMQDRYRVLEEMRIHRPIYSAPDETVTGRKLTRWTFTAYDDVLTVLKDKRFVREDRKILPDEIEPSIPEPIRPLLTAQKNSMLFRDPPEHTRLRSLVNKAFTPRMVEQLGARIQHISMQLLEQYESGDTFDVVNAFAFPLPVIVIAELLGVPSEDRHLFKDWSTKIIHAIDYKPTVGTLVQGSRVFIEFQEYLREFVHERTLRPRNDLVSELIRVQHEGEHLSESELLEMCVLVLVAGHETTVNLIANAIYLLAQYPEQQQLLRNKPSLLSSAIEEVLRFESPVQFVKRTVGEDMEYKGHFLKRGDFVNVWIASANRDSLVFQAANTFDVTRENNRHLTFGQGIHYCLGAPLARKEGLIALQTFLSKYQAIELLSDSVSWRLSPAMRSLKELTVQV